MLYQVALETMKTQGPFAILADRTSSTLDKKAAALVRPLEEACGIALYVDNQGEPATSPDEGTPTQAEGVPVATTSDGRPIMPTAPRCRPATHLRSQSSPLH